MIKTELEILKEIKQGFQYHSDTSTRCYGYDWLLTKIERLESEPTKELKPLSEITDVDAIEVAKMDGYTVKSSGFMIEKGKKILNNIMNWEFINNRRFIEIIVFLQSKGYKIE